MPCSPPTGDGARLPTEPRLLDAAHIIVDADEQLGQPIVSNGLPLTKLHHAAFDWRYGSSNSTKPHRFEPLSTHRGTRVRALPVDDSFRQMAYRT
jgi:HNH endonuclease